MIKTRLKFFVVLSCFFLFFASCSKDTIGESPTDIGNNNGITVKTVRMEDLPEGVVLLENMSEEQVIALLEEQAEKIRNAFPKNKRNIGKPLLKTRSENPGWENPDSLENPVTLPPPPDHGYQIAMTDVDTFLKVVASFKWGKPLGDIEMETWVESELPILNWEHKGGTATWSQNQENYLINYYVVGLLQYGIPSWDNFVKIYQKTIDFEDTYVVSWE